MFFSSSECVFWLPVFTAESVAIVTANLLAIILFTKNRSLCTRSMYLVISLTVADMLVGVLSGGYATFARLWGCRLIKLNLSRELIIPLGLFFIVFPVVSLTNIAVISLERFHATFRPFRHRLIKRWVYVVAITVVWVFPVIVSVISVVEFLYFNGYHLYMLESYCLLCFIVIFVFYTSILFKFRFGAHPQRHCAAVSRQRKLTVTLFIATLVSLLLWLPYSIFHLVLWSTDNSLPLPVIVRLNYYLIFFFLENSFVNPILYTIRMPEFKKALLSLFRRHQREHVAIPLNRY